MPKTIKNCFETHLTYTKLMEAHYKSRKGKGRDKYQIERYDRTLDKRFKFQLPDGNDYRLIEHTELFK